jgi:sarcosine oxidase subunit gamma
VNTALAPEQYSRRSFLYRKLAALGAQFVEIDGAAVASQLAGNQDEAVSARVLALADLSLLRRVGFKGAGAADWLSAKGVLVPAINRLACQSDGALVLRLGANDIMVTTELQARSRLPDDLLAAWNALDNPPTAPRGFPVPRQEGYAWVLLSGAQAATCMAKICGVDLRAHKFDNGAIAQTSVARLGAVVARADINGTLAFHLFVDSASAEYFWDCVIDAMQEFGGKAVGIDALRAL